MPVYESNPCRGCGTDLKHFIGGGESHEADCLASKISEVSNLLNEWRDPASSRMIHRDFAVAALEKALRGGFPDVDEAANFTKEAWDSLKPQSTGGERSDG